MQKQLSCLQILFRNEGFAHLAYKVISFLDMQTVQALIDIPPQQCNCHHFKPILNTTPSHLNKPYIHRMLESVYFMSQYMNHTDRSMYYSFYQESQFKQNQKSYTQSIIIQQSLTPTQHQTFSTSYNNITNIFNSIENSSLLTFDELEEVKRMFVDPSLPLPSIKRENQGMYCNSSFQLYLVGLRFPHYGQHDGLGSGFSVFEELQQRLDDEEEQCFKIFFEIEKNKHSTKKLYENLHLVRYMPYEITCQNLSQLLLQNNTAHNMIVYMFALTDVWINSIVLYVQSISDPYYKFIELMSRYAMFRSLVLEIQEFLGFLFRSYQSLYSDTIRDSIFSSSAIKPKYCFWRPALTKWFMRMKQLHKETGDVYFLLLTKLREERLMEKIECLEQGDSKSMAKIKKHQICLKNNLQMNNMTQQIKARLYQKSAGESIIENFIYNDELTCESLVFEYVEYMIDLSVNQQTVHWCGHSLHKLGKAFCGFMEQFLEYNWSYYANLNQKVINGVEHDHTLKKELIIQLLQDDLEFLQIKNVKAVVLRKLVEKVNCHPEKIAQIGLHEEQVINQLPDKIQQEQPKITSFLLQMDFTEKDLKLKYFNQKARICESIQGEQKYFFEIPPQLSPQEILSKSINTNDTSQNEENDADEGYEYVSDDQGDGDEEQEGKGMGGNGNHGKLNEEKDNINQMESQKDSQNQMQDQMENQKGDNEKNNNNKTTFNASHMLKVSQNSTIESSQQQNSKDNQLQNSIELQQNQLNFKAEQHLSHSIFKTNSF